MKIPHEKIKPFTTEIAPECSQQITALKNTGDMAKFTTGLDNIVEWCSVFGKTEMGRWADVLNDCDAILAAAAEVDTNNCLQIDRDDSLDQPLISILRFTSLLFENTFSRSVYSSIEHLIKLLDSRKIFIVVQTLRLLMVISKSSRFITQHLSQEFRIELYNRLSAILEIWSGRLRSVKLTEFCSVSFTSPASLNQIQIQQEVNNYQIDTTKTLTESMTELKDFLAGIDLQKAEIVYAFAKLRFVYSIKHHNERFYNVMARQIATSIIFYSRYLLGDESRLNGLANDQYIEQCCELLRFEGPSNHRILTDALKTETLKTLASIVFLEKVKKIQLIVDSLELRNYHGFCPTLIRQCTDRLKSVKLEASGDFSMTFITSLFSLIYHIAGFAYGGDALNHSSIIPILLSVIKAHNLPENYISYVTRSVRIIDILTGTEVIEFNANDGTETMINRFTHEIDQSKKHMEQMEMESKPILCNQQRSALMKSMLNFLKRAVMDFNLIVHIRRMMGADLPDALKHIIDNPKYYGSSLLHCAIALVTSFIYQEPAQLTTLQTKGLTDAIMKLVFSEKFPISRDLICVLVNVCSALCLNERGLNELKTYNNQKPISKIFNLIFSNRFLLSIRKRKTEILETAHMLGTSFDELIRHQPTLRREVMGTIAAVLDSILEQLKKKDISISWNIGKSALEEDPKAEHLPMGDFIGMMGIMFETMLTNRGIQDNIVVFNECGIPSRLVKMLSQAVNPNPILLNSNYLPNLANILCCVMRQISKVDDGFTHLVEACTIELDGYASIKDTPQERLGQITRLSSLVSTMNNLMKSVIHSQNAYDIRPFLLHHFANDKIAQRFMVSLFDTYKLMSSDKLLSAAQQTTTQILEDATKVQELLQINDQDNLMEVDDADPTQMSQHSSQESSDRSVGQIIDRATTSNDGETISVTVGTTSTTEAVPPDVVTERSIQQVAYRCQRQISELIVCLGKNFCNANVTRVRQRTAQILQINQDTLKKDYREVSKQVFTGLNRLLVAQTIGADGHEIASIPGNHIIQSLSLLKKVLIDDQSIQQMLPDFYTSECHKTFFDLVNNSLKSNLTKEDYISALHSWLNISQKLTSINLLDLTKQGRNGAQPRPPIASVVEGFELKNYLATSQKEMFMALCLLLNAIIAHCKESVQFTADSSPSTSMPPEAKEKQNKPFKLFEKLLESLKLLFKDMIKLLDLSENAEETHQEVPVNEIDPAKIQQLVEMGFSQSDALDALLQFSTIAEAAEYLVSQMERNIAMRAQAQHNEAAAAMVAPAPAEIADAGQQQQTLAGASTASIIAEKMNPFAELKPLTRELLQERMQQSQQFIFNGLNLMSRNRSLVNAVAELIAIFGDEPVGRAWVLGEFINRLKSELNTQIDHSMSNRNAGSLIEQFAATLHFFNLIRQAFPDQQIDGENGTTESDFTMMCTE